jgi:IK cytokine
MNQQDFRQVLADAKRAKAEKAAHQEDTAAAPKAKKKRSYRDYKQAKDEAAEAKADEVKYRDRAKERATLGGGDGDAKEYFANPDYDGINKAMDLDIEHSKYLGGDVQHTHLVKGLDFALLTKVRSELTPAPKYSEGGAGGSSAGSTKKGMLMGGQPQEKSQDGDKTMGEEEKASPAVSRQIIATKSRMARQLCAYMFPTSIEEKLQAKMLAETYLPGRTAFEFDLTKKSDTDIPTKKTRSKDDCPPPEETKMDLLSEELLGKISRIVSYVRQGTGGVPKKKKKKRERAESQGSAEKQIEKQAVLRDKLESTEDSIFGDVGGYEYKGPAPKKTKDEAKSVGGKKPWDFQNNSDWEAHKKAVAIAEHKAMVIAGREKHKFK